MAENNDTFEARDAQLRRAMLTQARLVGEHKTGRWVSFAVISAVRDRECNGVDSEDHAINLIGDLVAIGFLEEEQQVGFDQVKQRSATRRFRITDAGMELWKQRIPPHPLVDDPRYD